MRNRDLAARLERPPCVGCAVAVASRNHYSRGAQLWKSCDEAFTPMRDVATKKARAQSTV